MKTVKCGPGADVCTEAVGAVETSKYHPVVPSDSSGETPPLYRPFHFSSHPDFAAQARTSFFR